MKMFRDQRTRNNFLAIAPGNTVVVYDTETTGLDRTGEDEILQFAGVKYKVSDSGAWIMVKEYNQFLRPHKPIPKEVSDINHITNERVADEPQIEDVISEIVDFMDADFWCGHNIIGFDNIFMALAYEANSKELPVGYYNPLDTLDAVADLVELKDCKKYNLGSMCDFFAIEESTEGTEGFHDALYDVRQDAALAQILCNMYKEEKAPEIPYFNPAIKPIIQDMIAWKVDKKAWQYGNYYMVHTNCGTFKYDRYNKVWSGKPFRPVSYQAVIEAIYEKFGLISDSDLMFADKNLNLKVVIKNS